MKNLKNQIKKIIGVFMLIMMVTDCASLYKANDRVNPCTPGNNQSSIECAAWKENFPKEYAAYKERMKKQAKTN